MNIKTIVLAATLALVPCQSTTPTVGPPPATSDALSSISKFTVTDLQNADAIAVAYNDELGHARFPAGIKFVQSLPSSQPTTTVSGAISAFETARVTRMQVEGAVGGGIPNYLKLGC